MPILNAPLNNSNNGPIIEVTLLPPQPVVQYLESRNQKVPSKKVKALIDTGASCSCITKVIARTLKLEQRDMQLVRTPSGKSKRPLYDIGVILPVSSPETIEVQAIGAIIKNPNYQVLIGRDVLNYCTLFYNGKGNAFTLHY